MTGKVQTTGDAPARRRTRISVLTVIGAALVYLLLVNTSPPAAVSAEQAPPVLWKVGENCGSNQKVENGECGAAGETVNPSGIATDPTTGHIYVADQANNRISEFTAWGAFSKAWGWGVANGALELQSCGPEASPPTATCRAAGPKFLYEIADAPGQLHSPKGLAVDSAGNVYVAEVQNHRVQKFDREGHFLLMFGGGVDQGPHHPGNLCTAADVDEGDACGGGHEGTADGEFSEWSTSSFIAVGPGDRVYVGDKNRIQQFDSAGAYVSQIPLPKEGEVGSLAVDQKSGDIYFAYPNKYTFKSEIEPNVYKLNPVTGEVLGILEALVPTAITADSKGDIYVFEEKYQSESLNDPINHGTRIVEFDASGKPTATFAENEFDDSSGIATNTVTTAGDVGIYVSNAKEENSFVRAYGPPPDKWLPPVAPPTIAAEYAISVNTSDALLGAQIDPRFWADTSYYLQYGTHDCAEGGCEDEPAPPGSSLGAGVTEANVPTAGVFVSGLEPATTYHYRFVAESGGGGPVFGADRTFTTPSPSLDDTDCSNQSLRTGPSAALPDCRAYELVSPVDKEGGDVEASAAVRLDQASATGDGIAYSSYRPFGGALSAPGSSQYLASRGEDGWQTQAISALQEGDQFRTYLQLGSLFKAFSPDLSTAWNLTNTEPVIGSGGQAKIPNLYRRSDASNSYEACTTAKPQQSEVPAPELQGVSADQTHAIFRADGKLTPEANPGTHFQLYECSFGPGERATVRLVSFLPDGSASKLDATAGTQASVPFSGDAGHRANLAGAISDDGSRVFWTENQDIIDGGGPGPIYVRLNADQAPSPVSGGKCTKANRACTYPVSGSVSSSPARFWAAAKDGSSALFAVESGELAHNLYTFDVEHMEPHLIAKDTLGVLGESEDLTHVYFLSEEQIGGNGVAGQPNLYLYETGASAPTYTFVGTLSRKDAYSHLDLPSPVNESPDGHVARVSPGGADIVFVSDDGALAESVAGYDNTDVASGQPDAEVYRYDAETGKLACVSCNPSGSRPAGREVAGGTETGFLWADAQIPGWETSLYASHVLSNDGSRVFFESFEALVPADTNDRIDVYEWEQAGAGDCREASSSYVKASNGCLGLISSGKSTADSEFIDASTDGSDVFITTASSLVTEDPGQVDLYDAREGGGFTSEQQSPAACEGEACQGSPAPPNDTTPASAIFTGPGDLLPALIVTTAPKSKTRSELKAQALARAVKACKAKPRSKRKRCEIAARKRYGAKPKSKVKKSNRGGKRS